MPIPQLCRPPIASVTLRAAVLQPASFDAADNSCEVIWTTGATVQRSTWIDGEFDETLATAPENVRLDRLNSGAPVLANHDRASLASVIGSIVPGTARMLNGQGHARIRFAGTPDVAEIVAKVREGHIRSVSAAYIIHAYQSFEVDGRRAINVIDWEPVEISLVPVPADPGSYIRANEENIMPAPMQNNPLNGPGAASLAAHVNVRSIMTAARNAGLSLDAASELVDLHEATPFTRAALTAEIGLRFAQRDSQAQTNGRALAYPARDGQRYGAIEDAIYARMSGSRPSEQAREYMGASLANMARSVMEDRGERVRLLSDANVIERAMHATGDFPNLLVAAGNRYLMDTFAAAASAIKQVARERTANDFRDISSLKLGGFSALEKVNEGGEIKSGTFVEGAESYRLSTFAKIFGITRQALINDDLGAFADPLRIMARAAAEAEASELAALLNANSGGGATMADGNSLYHASHGNRAASGAALAVTTLSAGRQAMRNQTDLDGKTPVNSVPKFLLVGAAVETLAEQVLATLTPATFDQANPFSGRLEPLVDPRLTGNGWRLFADPTMSPVIEYAYLNSASGPQLESRAGWNVLGTEFRVVLDFGCGVVDHRGTYYNAGA